MCTIQWCKSMRVLLAYTVSFTLTSLYRVCKGSSFTARYLASYTLCSVHSYMYRVMMEDTIL